MHKTNKEDWSKSLPEDPQGADALWELSSGFGESTGVNVDEAWKQFEQKLEASNTANTASKNGLSIYWKRGLTAAAAAVALLFVINFFSASSSVKQYANTEAFAKTLLLDDNTSVTLAEGASLSVRMKDEARLVELIGKATFEVAPNKERPFTLTTPELTLVVIGTGFTVESGANANVDVFEGHVRVRGRNEVDWTDLYAGDAVTFDSELLVIDEKSNDIPGYPLRFDAVALSKVVESIEAAHHIELLIPSKLENCSITADFSSNTISEIASSLAVFFDAEMRIEGQTVELKGGRCQ